MKNYKQKLYELALANTLECSDNWINLSTDLKSAKINDFLKQNEYFNSCLNLEEIKTDGQIIVSFKKTINIRERGALLLDFEKKIKKQIEVGLTVWLEPIRDKSSLRNLRGIELKDYE